MPPGRIRTINIPSDLLHGILRSRAGEPKALGMRRSMSRTRNPWDNAVIERFFNTRRFELVDGRTFVD